MTFQQLEKELETTYIHIYPENGHVICNIQGNSLLLLAMVEQVLTEIVEKNGVTYDQALSALKDLHGNPRRLNDALINKILGDL